MEKIDPKATPGTSEFRVIQTEFQLEPNVLIVHSEQEDMLLRGDDESIDLQEVDEPTNRGAIADGDRPMEYAGGEDDGRGSFSNQRRGESAQHGPSVPRKRSYMSSRRERIAKKGDPTRPKKQRLEQGRLKKAQQRVIQTDVELGTLKPGLNLKGLEKRVYTRGELERAGIGFVPWDGISTTLILSKTGEVMVVLAGRPKDESYVADLEDLERQMHSARGRLRFPPGWAEHRRGQYANMSTGISYGGGSKVPGHLKAGGDSNERILRELEGHVGMRRLTGLIRSTLQTFAPRLSDFCRTILALLELNDPQVKRHFPLHPMACTTFNFGPKTVTFPHKDLKNLSWGLCSVTSMGSYDSTKGGHLVLWDLGMAVEFPPYATIFLPSAIVLHSNTSIGEDETRLTVTQYTAAGLFAWKAHGCKAKSASTVVEPWWKRPRHMFSKIEELMEAVKHRP